MLITNENLEKNFRIAFDKNLEHATSIKIASGYFGGSEIDRYYEKLSKISRNGGTVQLIHGMGGAEGIRSNLYEKLCDLNNELKKTNTNNGIFVHLTHYHGKMYISDNQRSVKVLIGSSNFSSAGFGGNLELNYCHSDQEICDEAKELFNRLKSNSEPINKINIIKRTRERIAPEKPQQYPAFNPENLKRAADASIEIHITNASNLNLFLSKGRVSKTGIVSLRPFYESELTIKKGSEGLAQVRKHIPDQKDAATYTAVTDLGTTFQVKFKRKSSKKGDPRTLHQCPLDFMSSPRSALGYYLKGKLMQQGLLRFGEPLTDKILAEYGNNKLDMYFTSDDLLYLKF